MTCPCTGTRHVAPCPREGKRRDTRKGRKRSSAERRATDAKRVRLGAASPRLREHVTRLAKAPLDEQEQAADALDQVFARDGGGSNVY